MRRPNRRPNYTEMEDITNWEGIPAYVIHIDGTNIIAVDENTGKEISRSTDFHTVFTAVHTAATAGDSIFIKRGTYAYSTQLEITKVINIIGESKYYTYLDYGGGANAAIHIDATTGHLHNMRFANFRIDANDQIGIHVETADPYAFAHSLFENLYITHVLDGIYLESDTLGNCYRNTIRDIFLNDVITGGHAFYDKGSPFNTWSNLEATDVHADGWGLYITGSNNHAINISTDGRIRTDGQNMLLENITVEAFIPSGGGDYVFRIAGANSTLISCAIIESTGGNLYGFMFYNDYHTCINCRCYGTDLPIYAFHPSNTSIGVAINCYGGGNWNDAFGDGTWRYFNCGVVQENRGVTGAVADGGTFAHGLGGTPIWCVVTGSVAQEHIYVSALGAANVTVGIKADGGGAGTAQVLYWIAGID